MKYYHGETVTGVINTRTYGDGIQSTETEKKHVLGAYINVDEYQDNDVEFYIQRENIVRIPDYFVDTYDDTGGTSTLYSTNKLIYIDLGFDLKMGETLKAAINCGATATDLRVVYVYEV